jgi:phosphatidylethanolamine/phosphatidyl-N-methylethanolamine N-methyltransferase
MGRGSQSGNHLSVRNRVTVVSWRCPRRQQRKVGELGRVTEVRSRIREGGLLWAAWLRAPRRVGAVLPSSDQLAAVMAREVPLGRGPVVELGGGTGSITAALLAAGLDPADLVVVERDPHLVAGLRRRFPRCRVLCGDAFRLRELLYEHGIREPVAAVVSSLPLLGMPPADRARLLRQVSRLIAGRGPMIQFTYGPRCPVAKRTLSRGNVKAWRVARVWRNLPPASVWRFEPGLRGVEAG